MKKGITFINSASSIALNFVGQGTAFRQMTLCDCMSGRHSFQRTCDNLRKSQANRIINTLNITGGQPILEEAIKDSNVVVFFTHDYFSYTVEKNSQLKSVAELCKVYGVDKLIAVSPIEHVTYYNHTRTDPLLHESNTHDEVIKIFPKATILRTNLIFGSKAYMLKFIATNWMNSYSFYTDLSRFNKYLFTPIHYCDLNNILNTIISDNSTKFQGKKLHAKGKESVTFADVDKMMKSAFLKNENYSQANKILQRFFFNWQLFFHGNTHVTNFYYLLHFFHKNNPRFEEYPDAGGMCDVKPRSVREYYQKKESKGNIPQSSDAVHQYWNISLD